MLKVNAEEDNKIIKELSENNDTLNSKMSSLERKLEVKSLKYNQDPFNTTNEEMMIIDDKLYDSHAVPLTSKKAVQTELEGPELQQVVRMLAKNDKESMSRSSDSKSNQVYLKLCETKIQSLENELKKNFKVDLDSDVESLLKTKIKRNIIDYDLVEPIK